MGERITRLREVTTLFLRLGATAFGGPAAHIVVMRHEVVERRAWMTDAEYAEVIALANLVPGPNSTEVAMHVGRRRAGAWGLVAAGVAFILPAFVLMTALAWAYAEYGTRPRFQSALTAIAPVVVVLILDAVTGLARTAVRSAPDAAVLAVAVAAAALGVHELAILAAAGGATWLVHRFRSGRAPGGTGIVLALGLVDAVGPPLAVAGPVALAPLFLVFLEVGSVLYGSGYVLYAFLEQILVHQHHWMTRHQLLDAITAGQLTPGPLFTTATFVGFTLRGFAGAVLATVGIFLPAFVFVGLTDPVVRRLRDRPGFAAGLRGVVAASLGLMVVVGVVLAREALTGVATVAIGLGAVGVLWWRRPNPVWLIGAAGLVGLALGRLG